MATTDNYIRIPIRKEEHQELLRLQHELTGKIDSRLSRPSLSDVIRYLLNRLYLRLEPELKAWLEAKANAEHLEVSAFVRQTLWKMKEQEKTMSYKWATQDRMQLANEILDGAGYNPSDYEGMTPDQIAEEVEKFYRWGVENGEIDEYPTWDDGDEVDIRKHVRELLERDQAEA